MSQTVGGYICAGGLDCTSAATGITAGTTRTQAGATALTAQVNRVDTATAPSAGTVLGDGVQLPASGAALQIAIINNTANPIQVYGAGSDTINGIAAATGVPLVPGDTGFFLAAAAGGWQYQAGMGNNGKLAANLAAVGITAGTTRTQGGATVLPADCNRVDTSTAPSSGSTLGDGVALPVAFPGLDVVVINNTSNLIQVYGNGSDTINGVAGASGVPIPPGDVAVFIAAATGSWNYDPGIGATTSLPTEIACDSISAAGANQAAATQLAAVYNRVTTATANQGVKLPASAPGLDVIVENHSGAALTVYGAGTDQIDDVASATGVNQMDSSVVIYTCYAAGKWYSNGLATGYAKNPQSGVVLETMQFQDGVSAAGSTQAGATQLTCALNTVSTATANQGVNLPASSAGLQVTVINTSGATILVYPAQGASDTINGVAAANGVALLTGTAATFNCTAAGAWNTMPASTKQAAYTSNSTAPSGNNVNLSAANITGGVAEVDLSYSGAAGAGYTLTLPTVAAMVLAMHAPAVGTSFKLRIINNGSGQTATVTTNTGWTLNGTLTVANNTWRDFVVTLTSLTAATLQSVGVGTYS